MVIVATYGFGGMRVRFFFGAEGAKKKLGKKKAPRGISRLRARQVWDSAPAGAARGFAPLDPAPPFEKGGRKLPFYVSGADF